MEGVNSRLDGLQAAILSAKLPHIEEWTRARQEKAANYATLLRDIDELILPKTRAHSTHVFHVFNVRVKERDALQKYLKEKGVETNRHYPTPLPLLKAYQYLGHVAEDFPVAVKHAREILSLPIFPEMTGEQMSYVAKCIKDFYANV